MSELFPVTLDGAEVRRNGRTIVGPVSLVLAGDGLTMLLGPNGAGKTTLLRMLHGLDRLSSGRVEWSCPPELARKSHAFVFQAPIVLHRTALENVAYPLRLKGIPKKEALARAEETLKKVGIEKSAQVRATRLSGGEKQKLALGRALVTDPKVLFLDEPCASLDGRSTREIEAILRTARAAGVRIIMSTHDLGQAKRLADDVLFLAGGLVREIAPADTFFETPKTEEAKAFLRGDIVE